MRRTPRTTSTSLLLATLLQTCLFSTPAHADLYDDLRTKWSNRSASVPALPANDPDVAMQPTAASAAAQYMNTYDISYNKTSLWPDLPLGTDPANIATSFSRLSTLMAAYNNPTSPYYQDWAVLGVLVDRMNWLLLNAYTPSGTAYGNWWYWQIGIPAALNSLLMSSADYSSATIEGAKASILHYSPNPTSHYNNDGSLSTSQPSEVGANLLYNALAHVLLGVVTKDASLITAGSNAMTRALPDVTTGDGFYADGSFVQHLHEPNVGSYGTVLINDISKLYYLLNDSLWSVSGDPNYLKPYEWAMSACRPMIYDGAIPAGPTWPAIQRPGPTLAMCSPTSQPSRPCVKLAAAPGATPTPTAARLRSATTT